MPSIGRQIRGSMGSHDTAYFDYSDFPEDTETHLELMVEKYSRLTQAAIIHTSLPRIHTMMELSH